MSQQGGHDAMDRFSPDMANPFAAELGSMAGRGGLARGMRPGTTPRAGRMPSGRSGGGLAGMRRHRS